MRTLHPLEAKDIADKAILIFVGNEIIHPVINIDLAFTGQYLPGCERIVFIINGFRERVVKCPERICLYCMQTDTEPRGKSSCTVLCAGTGGKQQSGNAQNGEFAARKGQMDRSQFHLNKIMITAYKDTLINYF